MYAVLVPAVCPIDTVIGCRSLALRLALRPFEYAEDDPDVSLASAAGKVRSDASSSGNCAKSLARS